MPRIISFPTDCGLKQEDWVGCLINDRNSLPWFVHENMNASLPKDLRSSDVVVLDGEVFTIWKRVVTPLSVDASLSGYLVTYLAWRLTDDKD